jgi:phage terminase large subunit
MNLASIKKQVKELQQQAKSTIGKLEFFKDKFCEYEGKSIVPFNLRTYQKRDLIAFKESDQAKMFLHMNRRAGKDSWCWPVLVDAALEHVGNYAYILPDREQAAKVIWRGMIMDSSKSVEFPDVYRFLDMIPKDLLVKKNEQEKILTLANGSVIYLAGATRPDSLRGINLRGVVFSEFAFFKSYEVYKVIQPVVMQSKAWMLINTTPNDYNYSWRLFKKLEHDDRWITRLETVETLVDENGKRYITEEDVRQAAIDGNMPEWEVRREFYCEASINTETLYYASEMKQIDDEKRIQVVPPLRNYPVHFAFDLGNDATPILGFQIETSGTIRIIYYHKPTPEVQLYSWYANLIKEFIAKNGLIMGRVALPHDSVKRTRTETRIVNALLLFIEAGLDAFKLKRCASKDGLINLSKAYLRRVIISTDCDDHFTDALTAYGRTYCEKTEVFGKEPIHNWASHPADCFQYLCQAVEEGHLSVSGKRMPFRRTGT